MRWTGFFNPDTTGTYTFNGFSDDGIIVTIAGNTLLNQYVEQVSLLPLLLLPLPS